MSLPDDIQAMLDTYRSISLEKAEKVKFMRRMDTKYLISVDRVVELLHDIRNEYQALEVASQRVGTYVSTYYDTSDGQMYHAHVTGRFPRYKVRERVYSQNNLEFFEVKKKSDMGLTSKRRIPLDKKDRQQSEWLSQLTPYRSDELMLSLINSFERITLINNEKTERVTLDFNLQFRTPSGLVTPVYDRVVIIELKQEKRADSHIKASLRSRGIRPCGFSKYCTGILLTGHHTSYKRYKPKFSRFIKTQCNETFDSTGLYQ